MNLHTKGPWHIANGRQIRSERDQIAMVWMMRGGEGKANAALISAAPDMLEVLQLLLSIDGHSALSVTEAIEIDRKARAAVEKATGSCV